MGVVLVCWSFALTFKLKVPVLPYKANLGCNKGVCERVYVSDSFRKPGQNFLVQENQRGHRLLLDLTCVSLEEYKRMKALEL